MWHVVGRQWGVDAGPLLGKTIGEADEQFNP